MVLSAFAYLIALIKSSSASEMTRTNVWYVKNAAFFFSAFAHAAYLLLAIFCLVALPGATGVIIVAFLKVVLDLGIDLLSQALIIVNKQIKPLL